METHQPDVDTFGLDNLCNDDEVGQVLDCTECLRIKNVLLLVRERHRL